MSRFGDENFKSDVYESLDWLISEEPIQQIEFLHRTIIELISNGIEYIDDHIADGIKERGLTIKEALEDLGEVYSSIAAWDLINDN